MIKLIFFFVFSILIFLNCSVLSKKNSQLIETQQPNAILLQLSGKPGQREINSYHSHTYTKIYENHALLNEREEIIDFKLQIETKKNEQNRIYQSLSVIEKEGMADLHDMAFPELGETLEMIYTLTGQVLQAGDYPKKSLFYIPSIPLPDKPVKVGETWLQYYQWFGLKNGLPLNLELLTIFKGFYRCQNDECVDLEISGRVFLPEEISHGVDLQSLISGRLLFNKTKGFLIWSDVRNEEVFKQGAIEISVVACLDMFTIFPENLISLPQVRCKPKGPYSLGGMSG